MRRLLDQRLRLPGRRPGGVMLLALAGYALAFVLSERWTLPGAEVPLLWLPLGFAFAFVAAWGRWFAAPVAVVTLVAGLADHCGVWESALLAGGTALAALAISAAAEQLGGARGERPIDTIVRSFSSALGSVVGGAFMVVAMHAHADFGRAIFAQFAGVLVTGPFARAWLMRRVGIASRGETIAMLLTTAAVAEVVSSGLFGGGVPLTYACFPPVVWAALRTGRRGVGAASFVVAVLSAWNLAAGRGPFVETGQPGLALDAFLVVLALTGALLVGIENARRREERRFRAMIENATDIVTVYGPDGLVTYQSPSAERILGYRPEELVGRQMAGHVHPDDLEGARAAAERARDGDDAFELIRFRHRDGHWVELDCHLRDLSAAPEVGGLLVNARDVTAARFAERELAAAERRYRELVERLPLAVYIRPLDSAVPGFVSPQMEELFGYPASQWLTEPDFIRTVIHPNDREELAAWLEQPPTGEVAGEFRIRAADGRWVWVYNRRTPVRDAHGDAIGFQGCLLDITERKVLEEQLQQSQRLEALGLLAGGVAHDFNNLLTAISGYTELVRVRITDELARQDLAEVLTAVGRASELTHQLLAFGRRQTMTTAIIDLNDVVERTERMLARLIDERFEVVCNLGCPLHTVRADPGQIEQVLVNLALNARDAMGDHGTLTIETSNEVVLEDGGLVPPGEYACVSVRDTGSGFEADVRARLFEPFFTTKEIGSGTGLGLAVVFGIVEQSGGYILVESELGAGSEFRVLLPRSGERPVAAAAEERPALPGSETILLVEDEEVVRTLTKAMLETQRYRVIAVATPAEALAVTERWDLLLTDVVMPGMSGVELARRFAATGRESAVLFTSGYSAAVVEDGSELPGRLLEKPFTLEELAYHVREAIEAAVAVRS